ncbi:MAG: hypothetical protein SOV71_04110 [Anaerovoracaceae bacterium]|nr:hypothetical protein [Bacillota bacterium]MDY2670723.1 hypothetical protein [Anaerovoracaceae bacterium]
MYRDMAYMSLAKVNPAFLERLTRAGRLDNFLDTLSEFAADAHFEIERQILDQYKNSDEYRQNKSNRKIVNYVVNSIDRSVLYMVPDLIDQALMPGSDVMLQLEQEEDEYESFKSKCDELFISGSASDELDDLDDEEGGPVLVADLEEYIRRELRANSMTAEEVAEEARRRKQEKEKAEAADESADRADSSEEAAASSEKADDTDNSEEAADESEENGVSESDEE